jgi:hypothetical protein
MLIIGSTINNQPLGIQFSLNLLAGDLGLGKSFAGFTVFRSQFPGLVVVFDDSFKSLLFASIACLASSNKLVIFLHGPLKVNLRGFLTKILAGKVETLVWSKSFKVWVENYYGLKKIRILEPSFHRYRKYRYNEILKNELKQYYALLPTASSHSVNRSNSNDEEINQFSIWFSWGANRPEKGLDSSIEFFLSNASDQERSIFVTDRQRSDTPDLHQWIPLTMSYLQLLMHAKYYIQLSPCESLNLTAVDFIFFSSATLYVTKNQGFLEYLNKIGNDGCRQVVTRDFSWDVVEVFKTEEGQAGGHP